MNYPIPRGEGAKWRLALGIAALVVALDQVTKAVVAHSMELHQSIQIVEGFLALTYVRNTGAAFGLMARMPLPLRVPFFFFVSSAAVGLLIWFLRGLPSDRMLLVAACGAVIGGAIGNMVDRVTLGEVIDFVDVYVGAYHWPAFNVADAGITVGVALLCLDALRRPAASHSVA